MPIAVKLQTERTPCGYAKVNKSKLIVHKIEVVMQAFAQLRFEICLMVYLIVPWFIGVACFHSRKNVNQAWMVTTFFNDCRHQIFLADMSLGNKLNSHT